MLTATPPLVVVKVGGSIQDDPAQLSAVMADVAAAAATGRWSPIVVHGGGKAISAAMKAAGLVPRFVQGQRFTDEPTLAIAEWCLAGPGSVNEQLLDMLASHGARAAGLTSLSACPIRARRLTPHGSEHDLGLVGQVTTVESAVLLGLAATGVVPVVAPVALADRGTLAAVGEASWEPSRLAATPRRFNVNADLAAGAIAAALRPAAFILVSDTPGIRDDSGSFLPSITRATIARLEANGTIDGGMKPKVHACLAALDAGVPIAAIIDGRRAGSLAAALALNPARPNDPSYAGTIIDNLR